MLTIQSKDIKGMHIHKTLPNQLLKLLLRFTKPTDIFTK